MSHELRTPLNSVIVLSGVLNRRLVDKIPEEEYSYLEVIESIVKEGSEFTFSLPQHYASENRIIKAEHIPEIIRINKPANKSLTEGAVKTILMVEDSEPAVIQIKDLLEESDYHILVARDASEDDAR